MDKVTILLPVYRPNPKYLEEQLPDDGSFYPFDMEGVWLPEGWYTYTVTARLSGGAREEEWSARIYIDGTEPEEEVKNRAE